MEFGNNGVEFVEYLEKAYDLFNDLCHRLQQTYESDNDEFIQYEEDKIIMANLLDLFDKYKREKEKYGNVLNRSIEIEDYNGNTIMAIELDNIGNIINYENCDIADIDKDYIFDTDKELIRLQCNGDIKVV